MRSLISSIAIRRKLILDENGDPAEVVIPYDQFVEMVEIYGLDLADSEESDSRAGRREAFVPASDV